jgi:Glycosyl transferase family 2
LRATLILLAFNQEAYVRQAALSCLAQECEPIEIIFSDDASSDATFQILEQVAAGYAGPHQLVLRRNARNIGIGAHYNLLTKISSGALVITAAGDDISLPSRVRKLLKAWDSKNGEIDLVTSYLTRMQSDGNLLDVIKVDDLSAWDSPEKWFERRPVVVGAAHGFSKRLLEKFGPLSERVSFEDQVMSFRASCLGAGITIAEPLVCYRDGGVSSRAQSDAGAQARHRVLMRRHSQQVALYEQLHADLLTANKAHLFSRKYVWRLSRSAVFVEMLGAGSNAQRWRVLRKRVFENPATFVASLQSFCVATWLTLRP